MAVARGGFNLDVLVGGGDVVDQLVDIKDQRHSEVRVALLIDLMRPRDLLLCAVGLLGTVLRAARAEHDVIGPAGQRISGPAVQRASAMAHLSAVARGEAAGGTQQREVVKVRVERVADGDPQSQPRGTPCEATIQHLAARLLLSLLLPPLEGQLAAATRAIRSWHMRGGSDSGSGRRHAGHAGDTHAARWRSYKRSLDSESLGCVRRTYMLQHAAAG